MVESCTVHGAILQGLDQYVPSPHGPDGRMWYGVDNFKNTADLWDDRLLIYCPDGKHIPWREYIINPDETLQKYGARIVGKNKNSRVTVKGSKMLISDPFICDDETNRLIETGNLGISTDFYCDCDGNKLSGNVIPNYIAVFPITAQNEQGDLGARFMNSNIVETSGIDRLVNKIEHLISVLTGRPVHQNTLIQPDPNTVPKKFAEEYLRMQAHNTSMEAELKIVQKKLDELQAYRPPEKTPEEKMREYLDAPLSIGSYDVRTGKFESDDDHVEASNTLAKQMQDDYHKQHGIKRYNAEESHQNVSVKPVEIGSYNAMTGMFE